MKQEKRIWEKSRTELFRELECRETGLSQAGAERRMEKYGANELRAGNRKSVGLEEQAKYSKTDIESAIIDKLRKFLLELGKGYFFEARQKRFSYDEENF